MFGEILPGNLFHRWNHDLVVFSLVQTGFGFCITWWLLLVVVFSHWGKSGLVKNFLVNFEIGDFEASEISVVIFVLVVLTSTRLRTTGWMASHDRNGVKRVAFACSRHYKILSSGSSRKNIHWVPSWNLLWIDFSKKCRTCSIILSFTPISP